MYPKVKFEVNYGFFSDYLNSIIESGFELFSLNNTEYGFTAICFASDYKAIARKRKKYQCRIKIVEKRGAYFGISRIIKRKGIIVGTLFSFLLVVLFSNVIWRIEIDNVDQPVRNSIVARLTENNIYAGAFFSKEKLYYAQQQILKERQDISFLTLNFYRGVLECNIYPRTDRLDFTQNTTEHKIVSVLDGVITDIRVYSGFPVVSKGQSVSAGDVMVTNTETDKYNNISTMVCDAYIEGICNKEYIVYVPFEKDKPVYTGCTAIEYKVFSPFGISESDNGIWKGWENSTHYTTLEYLSVGGFSFPVTLQTTTYYERASRHFSDDLTRVYRACKTHAEHLIRADKKLKKELLRSYDYFVEQEGLQMVCRVKGLYEMT